MICLKNTLSDKQMQLLGELFSRGSMQSLSHCLQGSVVLDFFQTVSVAYAVIAKACLLNIDTGLGKTLIAAGIINVVTTLEPKMKWIYICPCSNLATTSAKLSSHLVGKNLVYCDSTENKVLDTFFTLKSTHADVLVLSEEATTLSVVEGFLFRHKNEFRGIFVDESQMISNLTSHTSRLISAIVNSCEYKILLTATPLRVAIEQVVNQIYMLDREMFTDVNISSFLNQFRVWDDRQVIGYRDVEVLQQMLMPRMLSLSRADLQIRGEYTPHMRICESRLTSDAGMGEVVAYKASPSSSTMYDMLTLVRSLKQSGKRGLIYANRNVIKRAILSVMREQGIAAGIMDGSHTTTQQQKAVVHKRFLDGELDVLVTNVTTGKDLPCDYIIFYELTFDYKQMLGRGERGLSGTDLDIYFIITDSTYEMRFFYTNVFQRCLLLEQLCGKDMPELHTAVEQLELILKRRGISLAELIQD